MIGKNIAPGIQRNFVSEEWPRVKKEYWKDERISARKAIIQDRDLKIIASDIDKKAVKVAEENAFEIGVDDCIEFKTENVLNLKLNDEYGVIISNPPYGERIGEKKEVEKLYREIGKKFNKLDTWSIYILTSNTGFEKLYGKKADRRRKLFNGRIRVDYYQYYGPRPPRK